VIDTGPRPLRPDRASSPRTGSEAITYRSFGWAWPP